MPYGAQHRGGAMQIAVELALPKIGRATARPGASGEQ
jgi:hypothetical protein